MIEKEESLQHLPNNQFGEDWYSALLRGATQYKNEEPEVDEEDGTCDCLVAEPVHFEFPEKHLHTLYFRLFHQNASFREYKYLFCGGYFQNVHYHRN